MVKLSKMDKDEKVMFGESIYTVEEVINDLSYFTSDEDRKLYTTTKYHASIDAASMLDSAIDSEYEYQMYEDWDESVKQDITDSDIEKIQVILDEIFSRNKSQNITYYENEEIEIDIFN